MCCNPLVGIPTENDFASQEVLLSTTSSVRVIGKKEEKAVNSQKKIHRANEYRCVSAVAKCNVVNDLFLGASDLAALLYRG